MDHKAMVARIEERMRALGLTQKGLARAAGLAETYVRDLREGRSTNPRASHLLKLATALGMSLGELVEGVTPGLHQHQSQYHPPPSEIDDKLADDRFGQVAAAVETMLRDLQAPHDTATIARMARVVWRDIATLPLSMSFDDRLSLTLSERRSKVERARQAMFEPGR